MRQQFIPYETDMPEHEDVAETLEDAWSVAPWAAEIIECEGGFMAFESYNDARVWTNQR